MDSSRFDWNSVEDMPIAGYGSNRVYRSKGRYRSKRVYRSDWGV